ncbi:Patched protein 9, partial [Trichostrongylus colubriformis]
TGPFHAMDSDGFTGVLHGSMLVEGCDQITAMDRFLRYAERIDVDSSRDGSTVVPALSVPATSLHHAIPCCLFVDALTETAASLFLTSLTDGLSFSIGSVSDFYAVRVFCTYCAMAILFMFLFQITFFNAVMVLCCRREIAGRHSLFCYRVPQTGKQKSAISTSSLSATLGESLARFVSTTPAKIFIVVLYLVYLTASINFALELPLGLDLKLLAPTGSYLAEFLRAEERLFNDYGTYCFAVVRLRNCSPFASKGEFWLEEFEKFHAGKALTKHAFNSALLSLSAKKPQYRTDIKFDPDGDIKATKMMMRIRLLGTVNEKPRTEILRKIMLDSEFDGFVYDTSFLIVDQQLTTVTGVITNVVTAILTMLVICILMVPRPLSASCIAVSILSINLGVVGALSAAGIRLDIISMITIVMSIGFSVDYVTHTTFHFIVQRNDRLKKCLVVMTEPILQAALSTVVGVSLLALVPSYIVRTFVMTVFAVVAIGVLHGLIFVPVLLAAIVPDTEYLEQYSRKMH